MTPPLRSVARDHQCMGSAISRLPFWALSTISQKLTTLTPAVQRAVLYVPLQRDVLNRPVPRSTCWYRPSKVQLPPALPECIGVLRRQSFLPAFLPRKFAPHGIKLRFCCRFRPHKSRHGPAMPGNDNFLALLNQIEEFGELRLRRVDANSHNHKLVHFFSLMKAARPLAAGLQFVSSFIDASIPKRLAVWIFAQPTLCIFERIAKFVNPRSVLLG